MALNKENFIPLSAMANSNAPRIFSYNSGGDNLAAVKVSGYFNDVAKSDIAPGYGLLSGDFILVDASDGQSILFVAVVPATGVTTTASSNDFA